LKAYTSPSIIDAIRNSISFLYYVSPIGYLFDKAKHYEALYLFSKV
jgi:hypothetical protein